VVQSRVIHSDVVLSEGEDRTLGQPHHAMFGCRVADPIRQTDQARTRPRVHDDAGPLAKHVRKLVLEAQPDSRHVDRIDTLPQLSRIALARPMPEAAPATSATLSSS
jgi:hypothetical protein